MFISACELTHQYNLAVHSKNKWCFEGPECDGTVQDTIRVKTALLFKPLAS